jgi:hypothetical protein
MILHAFMSISGGGMKRLRLRLSTLLLLVVILALSFALMIQQQRANRREAELNRWLADYKGLIRALKYKLDKQVHPPNGKVGFVSDRK